MVGWLPTKWRPLVMPNVTRKQLAHRIADSTGFGIGIVDNIVKAFLENIITDVGKGNRLEFREFGVFSVMTRKSRIAQNPKTLSPVKVPAKLVAKFKPGLKMREVVNGQRPRGSKTRRRKSRL